MDQTWILEADIYRLKKELIEASPDCKAAFAARLRVSEAKLNRLLFDREFQGSSQLSPVAG